MPAALAMCELIRRDLLGEVYQVSFLINVLTPWDLWPYDHRISETNISMLCGMPLGRHLCA